MTEISILTLGSQAAFIAVAGVYVYTRERFTRPRTAALKAIPVDHEPSEEIIKLAA
jgi:hypothetical protein